MKVRKLMIMAVLWGVFITEGQAVDNLIFKGKLIVPDCTVNNGNPVETNFGDIEIQTLAAANTGYHWENIRVPVNCPYSLGAPKIRLTGSQAAGARNSIKTSRYDAEKLVIYLHQGTKDNLGKAINLGSYQKIAGNAISNTGGTQYEIRLAAGVGREGGMELLTAGPFEASASMEIRYE
mgnify:FL=1